MCGLRCSVGASAFVLSCLFFRLVLCALVWETQRAGESGEQLLDRFRRRAVALREILVRLRVRVRVRGERASVADKRCSDSGELISSKMARSKNGDQPEHLDGDMETWRLTDNTSGPVPAAFLTLTRCLRRPLFVASIAGPSTCSAGTRYRCGCGRQWLFRLFRRASTAAAAYWATLRPSTGY